MNLGLLIKLKEPHASKLSTLAKDNIYYSRHERLDGSRQLMFDVDVIKLLDDVLFQDNLEHLTANQERVLKRYLFEGGEVTDKINTHRDMPYKNMHMSLEQLDEFLGSWMFDSEAVTLRKCRIDYDMYGRVPTHHHIEYDPSCTAGTVPVEDILALFNGAK